MDKSQEDLNQYLMAENTDSAKKQKLQRVESIMSGRTIPNMGCHLICDFVDIDPTDIDLDNMEMMDEFLSNVIINSKATIEGRMQKKFEPQGLSILYLLSESHFSIHTWPESNACAIDFYHCGDDAQERMKIAEELLCERFGWKNCTSSMLIKRGSISKYLLNDYDDSSTIFKNIYLKHRQKTPYQDLRVFESEKYGKMMVANEQVIITEEREYIYLSDLIKQSFSKTKVCENVLVIGGGDLEISEYILQRYPKIKKLTIVDIDKELFKLKKKFFNISANLIEALQEQKLKIVTKDANEFLIEHVSQNMEKYDAVIIDCYDIDNQNYGFGIDFYRNVYECLKTGCAFSQFLGNDHFKNQFEHNVRKVGFNEVSFIYTYVPVYSSCVPIGTSIKQ